MGISGKSLHWITTLLTYNFRINVFCKVVKKETKEDAKAEENSRKKRGKEVGLKQ